MLMKLVVGFITYNNSSAKYLSDFLPSLKESLEFLHKDEYKILAFDNSDQDDHVNKNKIEEFNQNNSSIVEYLSTDNNLGFSRAYNILIRSALRTQANYFLIINPDVILEKDAIKNLVLALSDRSDLGSVSPKIRRWDFNSNTKTKIIDSCGLILKPGLRFSDLGQGSRDDKQFDKLPIIGPSGAAGLFRISALETIQENNNYFDENFFMYKEDCDLAYRLSCRNIKSILVPEAIVYHDRTASSHGHGILAKIITRSQKSRQVRSWSFINQHFLFIKHWSKQGFFSKFIIICQVITFGIFSLILEQYNLKEYKRIIDFKANL